LGFTSAKQKRETYLTTNPSFPKKKRLQHFYFVEGVFKTPLETIH